MKKLSKMIAACALLVAAAAIATAQGPGRGQPRDVERGSDPDDLVTRMMAFDKNNDGKLTKAEVTDERLQRLVDRADTDKDGVVTKAELTALAGREQLSNSGGGPGGFGPPGGGGPGGPRMGMGGPPRPGEILPAMLRQRLNLNAKQEKQLADLQKHVDAKLEEILSADQRNQLKSMRMGGPGGFGPPGGPGGRRGGGPGGGPGGGGPGDGGRPGGGPPPPPPEESR